MKTSAETLALSEAAVLAQSRLDSQTHELQILLLCRSRGSSSRRCRSSCSCTRARRSGRSRGCHNHFGRQLCAEKLHDCVEFGRVCAVAHPRVTVKLML
jgi:hypothetical protein